MEVDGPQDAHDDGMLAAPVIPRGEQVWRHMSHATNAQENREDGAELEVAAEGAIEQEALVVDAVGAGAHAAATAHLAVAAEGKVTQTAMAPSDLSSASRGAPTPHNEAQRPLVQDTAIPRATDEVREDAAFNDEAIGEQDAPVASAGFSTADSVTAAASDDEDNVDYAECRICRVDEPTDALLAPCECAGSMKYVHAECLDQWRRHNMQQSNFCSVCNSQYNCVQVPTLLGFLRVHAWMMCSPRALWGALASLYNHVISSACTRHSSCLMTRMCAAILLIVAMAFVGRAAATVFSVVLYLTVVFDSYLDEMLLGESMLQSFHRILPAMNFTPALLVPGAALDTKAHRAALELLPTVVPCHDGAMGMLTNVTSCNFTEGLANLLDIATYRQLKRALGAALGAGTLAQPTMSWEDVILSLFAWSLTDACAQRFAEYLQNWPRLKSGLEGGLLPLLATPKLLLADASLLMGRIADFGLLIENFLGAMMAFAHFAAILLPLTVYTVRRLMHALDVLPMDAIAVNFADGSGVGLHLLLVLFAVQAVAGVSHILWLIVNSYYVWRVENSLMAVAAPQ